MLSAQKIPEKPVANGIFWLASYPKSGNTWFRVFLSNLLADGDLPVSINSLSTGPTASSRGWLDNKLGFDSADLYQWEIDRLRPDIYDWTVEHTEGHGYHKIHDACWQLDSGRWLASAEATAGAVYFVRNPLDVAISYANHNNSSIDAAISRMARPGHCLAKNRHCSLTNQTEQRLLTWSQHVISWVDNPVIDTYVMRYEDMKHRPGKVFTGAANYLKLPSAPDRISKALLFSNFNVVQQQETEGKFHESPPNLDRFFRKGITGDWQKTLTIKQIDRIISRHYDVMHRFGYLNEDGNPQIM